MVDTLTDPDTHIPPHITKITGISNEMVEGKPPFKSVLEKVMEAVKKHDAYIVAHNAKFEKDFINYHLGIKVADARKYICTRSVQRKILGVNSYAKGSTTLEGTAKYFKLEYNKKKAHRARYDVELTHKVFVKQMSMLGRLRIVMATKKYVW